MGATRQLDLAEALRQALAGVSAQLTISSSSKDWAAVQQAHASVQICHNDPSDFIVDFWRHGVEYAGGSTNDFSEIIQAILLFLVEHASTFAMRTRFTWLKIQDAGAAHERGSEHYVTTLWTMFLNRSDWPNATFKRLTLLIREAAKRPELRQLRPYTSLYALGFSRTTDYPFTRDCPLAEPTDNGLYRVYSADHTVLLDGVGLVHAVDALVAALPPNCGPAIAGTAEDL